MTDYFVTPRQPAVRPMDDPDYDGITFVYVFTTVLDPWVQPGVQQNVTLVVANAQGFVAGMTIVIENAGYYEVVSTDALDRMTVMNFGTNYNQPPGTGIVPGKITTTSLPGPPGDVGPPGPQGPAGPPTNAKGSVASSSALPASGNAVNDMYTTADTGHAWVWNGAQWLDLGPFQGPQGPIGQTGPTGPTGPIGNTGPAGVQGATGPQGPPGGASAYTTLASTFTMPAANATAVATVAAGGASQFGLGGIVYVDPVGYLSITAINTGANQLTLQNLGYSVNQAQGSTAPSGQAVTGTGPVGPEGPTGQTGPQGSVGPAGATGAQGSTGAQGATGSIGPSGLNAFNVTSAAFTVPAHGSTVNVTLNDASWAIVGQMLYIDQAGGGVGMAGVLQVTALSGNQLTLLNP